MLESSSLKIRVYDKHKLKKELIGNVEISVESIYKEPDRSFHHKWFCLSNVGLDYQRVMGYIKFSATVSMGEQEKVVLARESIEDRQKSNQDYLNLSVSPKFKLNYKKFKILVFKAERLVGLDFNFLGTKNRSDPYIRFDYADKTISTKIKKNASGKTQFNETLYVPFVFPTYVRSLKMTLLDSDYSKADDVFGTHEFLMSEIIAGKYSTPFWCYIYGAPEDAPISAQIEKMNAFPELASAFKGAIYMSINIIDDENSEMQSLFNALEAQKVAQASASGIKNEDFSAPMQMRRFIVNFEVFSIQNLHFKNKKLNEGEFILRANWAGKISETKPANYRDGLLEFYETMVISDRFSAKNYAELPDLIVTVVKGDVQYSYARLSPKDYKSESDDKYLILVPDKSYTRDLRDDVSGILHFRMEVNPLPTGSTLEFSEMPLRNHSLKKPISNPLTIIINLFQAKELPTADSDGSADPYVQIYHYGTEMNSSIVKDSVNPIWNERMILKTRSLNNYIPPLIIKVYDKDEGEDEGDFLGTTTIFLGLEDIIDRQDQILDPQWYALRYSNEQVMGKISLSASILNQKKKTGFQRQHSSVRTKMQEHRINYYTKIKILGLRGLKMAQANVKRPYIKMFSDKLALEKTGVSKDQQELNQIIDTLEGGDSPNIGRIIK